MVVRTLTGMYTKGNQSHLIINRSQHSPASSTAVVSASRCVLYLNRLDDMETTFYLLFARSPIDILLQALRRFILSFAPKEAAQIPHSKLYMDLLRTNPPPNLCRLHRRYLRMDIAPRDCVQRARLEPRMDYPK